MEEYDNESALLGMFVQKVSKFDPDIIVGHNLYAHILALVSTRMNKLKL